jgi:hypothetical protein
MEKIKDKNTSISLLEEAYRLNAGILFANSTKMKLMRRFLPFKSCIKLWWLWAKRSAHLQAKKLYRHFQILLD